MKTRVRATDATHSEIKTQMERRRQQSKEIKEWGMQAQGASRWVNYLKMKEEQNPYRAHLYRRKKNKLKIKHKNDTKSHTLLFISHY